MSRVCNFHVADSKPVQVPGPDQVRVCVLLRGRSTPCLFKSEMHSQARVVTGCIWLSGGSYTVRDWLPSCFDPLLLAWMIQRFF